MQLFAISYKNIGPFADKTVTVRFCPGTFLIKAPIGSGKSFLFFDGPVYALYKYSTRKMLNTHAKSGSLSLWFSHDEQQYCIHRQLKQGKRSDSCQSTLYTIVGDHAKDESIFESGEVLLQGTDMFALLKKKGRLEEISFKNEHDVQATLDSILPPREVFVSTHILLQDAPNIFDLTPADRLTIFKNVFNLLDVDHAKDVLRETKRDLQSQRTVLGDMTQANKKLQGYLDELFALRTASKSYDDGIRDRLTFVDMLFADTDAIRQKLAIEDFVFAYNEADFVSFFGYIEGQIQQIHSREQQCTTIRTTLQDIQQQRTLVSQKQQQYIQSIDILQKRIDGFDATILSSLKEKKAHFTNEKSDLLSRIPTDFFDAYKKVFDTIQQHVTAHSGIDDSLLDVGSDHSLQSAVRIVSAVITAGKIYAQALASQKASLEHHTSTLSTLQKDLHEWSFEPGTQSYDMLIRAIESKKNTIQQQLTQLGYDQDIFDKANEDLEKRHTQKLSQLKELSDDIHQKESFFCVRIDSGCPFVKQINTHTFEQLEKQRSVLEQEVSQLSSELQTIDKNAKIASFETQRLDFEKHLASLEDKNMHPDIITYANDKKKHIQDRIDAIPGDKTKILTDTIETYELLIRVLKGFLQTYDRKDIQSLGERASHITHEIEMIDKKLLEVEKQESALQADKEELQRLLGEMTSLQEQNRTLLSKSEDAQASLDVLLSQKSPLSIDAYKQVIRDVRQIEQLCQRLAFLVQEFKEQQLQYKYIQEKETMVSNLYTMFSKELVLLVLEQNIPILTDIINMYLAQIVGYEIDMVIDTSSDKVALDVTIRDELGEREVRALSGGQRVLLKLARMLAVASFMQTKLLFLDETINNLDTETVAGVADMLTDFVKQHQLKLYVVTHSLQIQDMGIWDGVISL